MAITLRRQLDEGEKKLILAAHGRQCFATGHEIPEDAVIHFDHIRAFADGGVSEIDNIAPMCEVHNKAKGTLPLEDFRVKLRLQDFFARGDALTLRHLLEYLKTAGDVKRFGQGIVPSQLNGPEPVLQLESGNASHSHRLYTCPATGWRYFYATLPVELVDSDDDDNDRRGLQPRYLIFDKVFGLYRHFQRHPVLQPSIGRIHGGRIVLFDGQHKIAALLWNGRRHFECKVYIDPDLKLLNETNIAAHDTFSQTRFYSSVMVLKLGTEFGNDFDEYKKAEDSAPKSEAGFMRYMARNPSQALTRGEINKRFRSYLINCVLQHSSNKTARFVSKGNRGTEEQPLTMDMLSKSLFAAFLYQEPVADDMATDAYKRDAEVENNVELMNMLYDLALSQWNPKAGPNDGYQLRLQRLLRSKSIMAWSGIVRDAVNGKLELQDAEDRERPFYRTLSVDQMKMIRKVIERLVNSKIWSAPAESEIDRILADNKSVVKDWLKTHGISTGYLMGAPE